MITPIVLKPLIFSSSDHPGIRSVVVHTDPRICDLNCFKCHNRRTTIDDIEFYSFDDFIDKLIKAKKLGAKLLIISGGEPILNKNLKEFLIKYNKNKILPVRIDTNGQHPEKLEEIRKYIDGIALDIKIPIKNLYENDELNRYYTILYSNCNVDEYKVINYVENINKTIEIMKTFDNYDYTIIRTVKYPLLNDKELKEIEKFVKDNLPVVDYYQNEFFDL